MRNPSSPPVVFAPHEAREDGGELFELDTRHCRHNAFTHSAHPFAVFCPCDRIVPSELGKLCDFSFVKLPLRKKSRLSLCHTTGLDGITRWQSSSSSRTG